MQNNASNAVLTYGDFKAGVLVREAVTDLLVVAAESEHDRAIRYTAGADVHNGTVELYDTSKAAVMWSAPAKNLYAATGVYVGTVLNFSLPTLV